MDIKRLQRAQGVFLEKYSGGFDHPDMVAIGKKHKLSKLTDFTHEAFAQDQFAHTLSIIEAMVKVVSRSSMMSVFDKPKFRDFAYTLPADLQQQLASGLYQMLHGNQQQGFEAMLAVLKEGKMARWSLITVFAAYYRPEVEIFVKPTTTKLIIKELQLTDLVYKPTPTWEFYQRYRQLIGEMKTHVDRSLSPNNPAFCGFLMMTL